MYYSTRLIEVINNLIIFHWLRYKLGRGGYGGYGGYGNGYGGYGGGYGGGYNGYGGSQYYNRPYYVEKPYYVEQPVYISRPSYPSYYESAGNGWSGSNRYANSQASSWSAGVSGSISGSRGWNGYGGGYNNGGWVIFQFPRTIFTLGNSRLIEIFIISHLSIQFLYIKKMLHMCVCKKIEK